MNCSLRARYAVFGLLVLSGIFGACRSTDIVAGDAASIEAASQTSFKGIAAAAIAQAPSVIVRDKAGRPVKNVLVRWNVYSGGGAPGTESSHTNASGIATSGGWILGRSLGTQELEAIVSGVGSVTFVAEAGTGPLSRLVHVSLPDQVAVVGTAVAAPPALRAEDAYGNPLPDVNVMFAVISGSGTIHGVARKTNAAGVAAADAWIMGTTRGQQLARAIAEGGASVDFSATAIPDSPSAIQIVSGNHQQAFSGIALPVALTVRALDQFENPVSGVALAAAATSNSGTVSPSSAITNSDGVAAFTWTPGNDGEQRVVVSSTAIQLPPVTFSATLKPVQFDIAVRYVDFEPAPRQKLAVERAVARIRDIIVGSSGVSHVTFPAGKPGTPSCGRDWMPAVNEIVSGVLIIARIGVIDGTGGATNVVGNATLCATHPATGLPVLGTLLLDSQDLAALESSGLIDPLVLHEIGHVLGIGTLWTPFIASNCQSSDPFFNGVAANAKFLQLGGEQYSGNRVPVEDHGGPGSRCSHWRESALAREVMSSVLAQGTNALSAITIGSLEDIGYTVSYEKADPFQLFASPFIIGEGRSIDLRNDVLPVQPLPAGAFIREMRSPARRR